MNVREVLSGVAYVVSVVCLAAVVGAGLTGLAWLVSRI